MVGLDRECSECFHNIKQRRAQDKDAEVRESSLVRGSGIDLR